MKSILLPILAGMAAAQVLGTLFVRQSNLALLRKVETLTAAGWLTIPMGPSVKPLAAMAPAILGGLFYTLSAGAGLAMLTWTLFFLRRWISGNNRLFLYIILVFWAGLLILVNSNGLCLFPTLFVLVIPMATALMTGGSKTSLVISPGRHAKPRWMPLIVLILLTGLWSTQLNQKLFIAIRDHVLLSNPAGQSVNDFYYRYTLYAAEAFKSFNQKTIKSCVLENFPDEVSQTQLIKSLARWDILVVADAKSPDMRLSKTEGDLILASSQNVKTVVNQSEFYKDPKPWLAAYSRASDRYAGFRRLILAGLLIGFPCLLYAIVYSLARTLMGLFCGEKRATWLSSFLCLLVGLGLFTPMLQGHVQTIEAGQLGEALKQSAWPVRVAALRYIETHKLEISTYGPYRKLLQSPMVVERYWLARALAVSRNPATYKDLLVMMDDPHPNVVCQAYYALGQRRNRTVVDVIIKKMRSSDHWYTQWYGYRAIRRLGWQQTPLKPTP